MTYNPDELSEYDADWDSTKEPDNGYRDVKPGTYQAFIERAYIDLNDYDNCHQLRLQLSILSGEFSGCKLFCKNSFNPKPIEALNGVAPIAYLKSAISKMKLEPPVTSASEVGDRLDEMLDRVMEVTVKAGKDPRYPKVYLNRFVKVLLSEDPPHHTDSDAPLDGIDGEIPF